MSNEQIIRTSASIDDLTGMAIAAREIRVTVTELVTPSYSSLLAQEQRRVSGIASSGMLIYHGEPLPEPVQAPPQIYLGTGFSHD